MLESSRDEHQVYCEINEAVRIEMPRKGLTVEFCDGQNQFKAPFIMYVGFESILEPIQGPNPEPMGPYTLPSTPPLVGAHYQALPLWLAHSQQFRVQRG